MLSKEYDGKCHQNTTDKKYKCSQGSRKCKCNNVKVKAEQE